MTDIPRRDVAFGLGGTPHRLQVITYGHWGRPVLVFPSEAGRAIDYENNGMVAALEPLLSVGRIKLYCVDSVDALTWSDRGLPTEERARRHRGYSAWLSEQVVPYILDDTGGAADLVTTGCSLGAYHAVQFSFERADVAPVAIGLSGNYDVRSWRGWGETGDATYFANPTDYVPGLHGDHLAWLQERLTLVLCVGQGAWETHPTGALPSTVALAELARAKGLRCELHRWGHDVSHDWEWWQRQIAHFLPRFC